MDFWQGVLLGVVALGFFSFVFRRRPGSEASHREDLVLLKAEKQQLEKLLQELQVEKRHQERVLEDRLARLSSAEKQLVEERERLRREQELSLKTALEERDRLWANFEQSILGYMQHLCEDQRIGLRSYTNTTLPPEFSGTLKPDLLVEVGDRYVVFDAKMSKSNQLELYIKDQVKKTAKKLQKQEGLFPVVFLVVPTDQLTSLRDHVFHEERFTFVVIPRESVFAVLYVLKLLSMHEVVEGMDPKERDDMVTVLSLLVQHLDVQNAMNTILTTRGLETRQKLALLPTLLQEDVERKRQQLRLSLPSAQSVREVIDKQ